MFPFSLVPSKVGQPQANGMNDKGDVIIRWSRPDFVAGLLDYYELKVETEEIDKKITKSIIKINGSRTACRLAYICDRNSKSKSFYVRPVNVMFSFQNYYDQLLSKNTESMNPNDNVDCDIDNLTIMQFLDNDKSAILMPGNWSAPLTTHCSSYDKFYEIMFIMLIVAVLLAVIFILFAFYRKVKRMKNIEIILPDGIMDIVYESNCNSMDCSNIGAEDERKLLLSQGYSYNVSNIKRKSIIFTENTVNMFNLTI